MTGAPAGWMSREGRERLRQRDAEWPVAVRAAIAYARLCQRMNAGDHPDGDGEEYEDAWAYTLSPDERAAYNVMVGANYGPDHRQFFTSNHPIVTFFKRYMKFRL